MTNIIDNNINEFMKLFEDMKFVSPDVDYDKFCEMNIVNEKRRAMSLFLTSLYKHNVITLDFVFDKMKNIQNMIMNTDNLTDKSKHIENEELTENLYIILTNISFSTLASHSGWTQIMDNLLQIKNIDTKKFMGISSKAKFKHMDILDKLK
jgi:ABC-type enterochelin transport system substrate-binding protein